MDPHVRIDVQPSEEDATGSRPGDLELVETKIGLENHADVDTSEAGPSFGGERLWGSPKLKVNIESTFPPYASPDSSEAEPSFGGERGFPKLKETIESTFPPYASTDSSEAEPSFGGEWDSPKLKENGEICPAPKPSRSEPWSSLKLKEPEEIASTSGDFHRPVSSGTDNFFERFQPETWKIEFYRAVASGDMKSFKRVLTSVDNTLTSISPQGNSALHVAVQYKNVKMAKEMIGLNANAANLSHCQNMNGDLPLHIAARVGCVDTSRFLISLMRTEGMETKNAKGDTALHDAVRGAQLEIVKLLVERNTDLTLTENNVGESPLFLAVDNLHFDIARELLPASSDQCFIKGRDSMNVLHAAIIRLGQGHQFGRLWNFKAILFAAFIDPILSSVYLPHVPLIPYTPKSTYSKHHTKIFAACAKFVKEVIRRYPSAVSEADEFGLTPVHYAAHYGCLEIFELLLEAGDFIVYKRDKLEGMSAVHFAARNGCVQVIRKLIEKFPDAWELLNDKGMTALHVAAESGKQNVVDYLLKAPGLEGFINQNDNDGNTPLHLAAIQGNHGILVKLADDKRVDGSAINNKGSTAADIVQSSSKFTNSEKAYISFRLNNRFGLLTLKKEVRQMKESEDKPVKEINKAPKEESDSKSNGNSMYEIEKVPKEEADSQSNGNGMYKDDMFVVVATLVASVTFGAALQIPGGYKGDDPGKGSAILIKQLTFNIFVLADCFSFALSSGSIFVHFWASMEKSSTVANKFRHDARLLTNLSIGGMVVAFFAGIHVALDPSPALWAASTGLCIFYFWGPWLIFNRIVMMINKKEGWILSGPY